MGDPAVLAFIGALVYSLINFVAYLLAGNWSPVKKMLTAYVVGVAIVALVAETQWGASLVFFDVALSDANVAEKIILGLSATSIFNAFTDIRKAIDNTDTARVPTFGGGGEPPSA